MAGKQSWGGRQGQRVEEGGKRWANGQSDLERRKLRWRTGAVLSDCWVGREQGWRHAVCIGRVAYSVLFFRTRN